MTRVAMLLCDYASVAEGKLYIAGGGWNITGPEPSQMGIGAQISLNGDQRGTSHEIVIQLFYEDGAPVVLDKSGEEQIEVRGTFSVGTVRQKGAPEDTDVAFAVNLIPQPLPAGRRYEWRLSLDGETNPDWIARFSTREEAKTAAADDTLADRR